MSKEKIEQVDRDIKALQKNKAGLEAGLEAGLKTYSIGDRFINDTGEKRILIASPRKIGLHSVMFSSLSTGHGIRIEVKDWDVVTEKEMGHNLRGFTRYWDNRLQQKEKVYVPDNIKFYQFFDKTFALGFGESEQALYWNVGTYGVVARCFPRGLPRIKPYLVPIEKKDIKAGDWVCVDDISLERAKENALSYRLALKDKARQFAIADGKAIAISLRNWKYCWKICYDK